MKKLLAFCLFVLLCIQLASGLEPTHLVGAARYDITGPAAEVNMVSHFVLDYQVHNCHLHA